MKHGNLWYLIPALCILFGAACAERQDAQEPGEFIDPGLPILSPGLVYAENWTELTIEANQAKTVVDAFGHYNTDKNRCFNRGGGVYSVATWNQVSRLLNQVSASQPIAPARCAASPLNSRFFNKGIATLSILPQVKRQIFELKNAEICTTIADPNVSTALMDLIEQTIRLANNADDSDCPTPRPPDNG